MSVFFFSSRRRHTSYALVTGVQTCALPIGIGVERIRAHNLARQTMLRDTLEAQTPQWRWPAGAIGGTLCIDTGADQPRVAAILDAQAIKADFRGSVMRLSFHAYSGVEDVAKTVAALGK